MNTKLKSFPVITSDFISWNKLDVDNLTDTVLTISMDAAIEAIQDLDEYYIMWRNHPIEYFNSDAFINDPYRQIEVINQVLNKHIGWK